MLDVGCSAFPSAISHDFRPLSSEVMKLPERLPVAQPGVASRWLLCLTPMPGSHRPARGIHRQRTGPPGSSSSAARRRAESHILPFWAAGARFRDFQITLLPAGHVFEASAQALAGTAKRGLAALHGRFQAAARPLRRARRNGSTPRYLPSWNHPRASEIPPAAEAEDSDRAHGGLARCRESLEDGAVPVLLGYSLRASRRKSLRHPRAGLTPMLHGAVALR